MCLAVPMRLASIDGNVGCAELSGVFRNVRLDLVPDATVGEYVIVHAGFAIQVMDEVAAAETLKTIRELVLAEESSDVAGEL